MFSGLQEWTLYMYLLASTCVYVCELVCLLKVHCVCSNAHISKQVLKHWGHEKCGQVDH